jgi:hypothetical protein
VTDAFAGVGLDEPGGPQVTLDIGVGAGLEATEDALRLATDYVSERHNFHLNEGQADHSDRCDDRPPLLTAFGLRMTAGISVWWRGERHDHADDEANTITIAVAGGPGGGGDDRRIRRAITATNPGPQAS